MANQVVIKAPSSMFLLFLVFLTLKLTGVIAWSWWLVTMPLWGGLAIVFIVFMAILFVGLILGGIALLLDR